MILQEILQKIVSKNPPILLNDNERDWEASALLSNLSAPTLNRRAYMQPGLYIAEIDDNGYLGRVMYKIKQR